MPSTSPLLPLSFASTHLLSSLSLSLSCNSHSLFPDPFQVQLAGGCDSHFGEASTGFMQIAYQGPDLVSFQNTSWWPSPKGGRRAQQVSKLFNQYHVVNLRIQANINDMCPHFLLGLLEAGKADLQRQVRPEAWLSTGPSPAPGRLLLMCHVSGFYPKPVWVTWMRGDQDHQGTRRGDVLPHADGTWYLQTSLDVEAREAAGLSCRVRHSSLGGQDVVLYWGTADHKGHKINNTRNGELKVRILQMWEEAECLVKCPSLSRDGKREGGRVVGEAEGDRSKKDQEGAVEPKMDGN
ncbi:T-cell surface glycoprotein CD1a-like isoform X6 [Leopardus geoffroyi]|uniref:T-cell surface glycoprotein CD1a-like isoform X6 n=1 Tax=Leopardus geoffroyi TaxID=46844 RepID=UPI001E263774|nr:T-cell surface glycoprotein CD1a-like isoform X6 [Leopardus geoffroyi]